MSKIGIFGGSFDPLHIGHIELAVQAKKELKLAEMLVIPAFDPPLKTGKCTASFAQRFEMARLAFGDMNGFAILDIEKKLGGRSYTINTVRALKEIYTGADLHLIIGGDQLFTIERWYRYESILKECHVCAVTRDGVSYVDMQEYANELGRVKVLNCGIPAVSSTGLREKLMNGEDVSGLIPGAVLEYIRSEGLYRG